MPGFRTKTIPLTSGMRQDLAQMALAETPDQLSNAANVLFTRKGAIRGRPGLVDRDAQVQEGGAGVALASDIADAVAGLAPAGIVAASGGSDYGSETPLALWQGSALVRRASLWQKVGTPWSARVTRSSTLFSSRSVARHNPAPCGTNLVGHLTYQSTGFGFPHLLTGTGEVKGLLTASSATFDAFSQQTAAVAGNALFYHSTTVGTIMAQIPGTFPAATIVTVGTGAATSNPSQSISAVTGESGSYYVAYTSSTAGRVTLVRLDSAGSVTATQNVNGLGTVLGVSICFNGTNKLCLAFINSATSILTTKVFTTTSSTFTDAAIDATTAAAETGSTLYGFAVGTVSSSALKLSVRVSGSQVLVRSRDFTTATISTDATFYGNLAGSDRGVSWDVLFPATVVEGRTLIGIMRDTSLVVNRSQWIVLDITDYTTLSTAPVVVASGQVDGARRIVMSPVGVPTAGIIAFCVPEGLTFDVNGVEVAALRRIELSLQGAQADNVAGLTFLSGATVHAFDGQACDSHGYTESFPTISASLSSVSAGGTLTASASYSYQATWEYTNGRGQVVRSGASNVYTVSTTPGNQTVNVAVTWPQLVGVGNPIVVTVKLYATQANPTAGAPLYLVATATAGAAAAHQFLVHGTQTDTTQQQLYTVGGVLADEPPPNGDRGVCFALDRIWVADQSHVYASKTLSTAYAPAWSTVGLHTLAVPVGLGQIQGLGRLDDKLVVVCSSGVLVVEGPGYNDLGQGPGWAMRALPAPGGGLGRGPRTVCSFPEGVAFLGVDGDLWLVSHDTSVRPVSRPVRETTTSATDVTWVSSCLIDNGSTNPLLVVGGDGSAIRVLDTEAGAWCVWNTSASVFLAGINGLLWSQGVEEVHTYSDFESGQDNGATEITMSVTTGNLTPNEGALGWGRVRGLTVLEKQPTSTYILDVQVKADEAEKTILNKSAARNGTPETNWPYSNRPQFSCSTQRCSFVAVTLSATPAVAEWSAIDLWVAGTTERAPSRSRS